MINNLQSIEVTNLLGPWLTTGPNAIEVGDVPLGRGILAKNVEYRPGMVKTRYGFSPVTNLTSLGDSFQSMEWWLAPGFSGPVDYLLYLCGPTSQNPGINLLTLSSGIKTPLYGPALGTVGAVFAVAGTRVYMATYDVNGIASDNPRVYSVATVQSSGGLDQLFQSPIPFNSVSFSNVGPAPAIGVTPGVHNFGLLLTTRNGLTGAVSPVVAGFFTPASDNISPAGRTWQFSVNAAWPTAVSSIQLIMTTTTNLAQYFIVPGASVGVQGGFTSTATVTFSIDDGTLAATATDATPYFTQLTGSQKVSFMQEYNNRMAYIMLDAIGVPTILYSDPNNYQSVSLARSVVYLPGQRPATSLFSLYGNSYIVGPHWTYYTSDAGGDPVTWRAPQLVDSQIGTLSPNGVTVNSAHGMAWVADVDGLYVFQAGAYADRPISYYQKSDWLRINWLGAAGVVRVVDNKDTHRVHVIVPLDGATTPTHIMTWDYKDGTTPELVNYSLDNLDTTLKPGCIALVQNTLNKHVEMWIGPQSITVPVLRQNDGTETNPYRDNGLAINSMFQTSLMPGLSPNVMKHQADHIRIEGNGTVNVTASSLDGGRTVPLQPISLFGTPDQVALRRYSINSEAATLTFSINSIDSWFQLSEITHYFNRWVVNR